MFIHYIIYGVLYNKKKNDTIKSCNIHMKIGPVHNKSKELSSNN